MRGLIGSRRVPSTYRAHSIRTHILTPLAACFGETGHERHGTSLGTPSRALRSAPQAVVCGCVCGPQRNTKGTNMRGRAGRGSQACLGSGSQLTQCQGPGIPPRDRAT
eukprot:5731058-Prymnesium_polylepis.1